MSDYATTALARAHNTTHWHVGWCDNFVANMYGYVDSGYNTALSHWNAIPKALKHPGDRNAPPGALLFFGGTPDGHVEFGTGGESTISTDINGDGTVGPSSISDTTAGRWHLTYLGWASPVFQGHVVQVLGADANTAAASGNVEDASVLSGVGGVFSGLTDKVVQEAGTEIQTVLMTTLVYVVGFAAAAGLILAGASRISDGKTGTAAKNHGKKIAEKAALL